MLKKILAFAMAATLCLTTVGCGKSAKSDGGVQEWSDKGRHN